MSLSSLDSVHDVVSSAFIKGPSAQFPPLGADLVVMVGTIGWNVKGPCYPGNLLNLTDCITELFVDGVE